MTAACGGVGVGVDGANDATDDAGDGDDKADAAADDCCAGAR